ncbi:MAG TPA: hypothetical protein VFD03_12205 [Clostridia bacterium]|nr:hypothetical protein [Clostridia bacterium]
MKDNKRIAVILTIVAISLALLTSAAATTDTIRGSTTESSISSNTGTPGVENNYVAIDIDIDGSGPLRQSGLIFTVPHNPGDTIEITATTNDPADFISCDSHFEIYYMINGGQVLPGIGSVYQSESYSKAKTYYLKKQIDRTDFNLIIRDSAGNDLNVKGHIKIVVHSKYPPGFEHI